MRQSEFKKRYDVKTGRYVKKHIYGEGVVTDVFKTIGRKLFGKTVKEAAKTSTKRALQKAATKTGEYAGEKAGDKIIQLLSKKNKNTKSPVATSPIEKPQSRELSDYEINERVNQLLSGDKMRRFMSSINIMKSFRDPKYVERYEDVIFDLETALNTTVANNAHLKKDGYRLVVDNSGEVTPFDWYNARISIFKVALLANGGNIAIADHNGIVNGSYSFLKHFDIKLNGKNIYNCNDANHAVNIKDLLDYSPTFANKTASKKFFFLDTSRNAEEREFEVSGTNQLAKRRAADNKGFALQKALLGTSCTVNTEIPLNRCSFFEMLEDKLLPNTRVEMNFEIESDGNLIWQAGADCRVVVIRMQLYVPRITFNSEGESSYKSQHLKTHKWTYLRENIERSNSSRQRAGHFRISTDISKPGHVFVFIINDVNIDAQTQNPFLYNTFSVSTDPRTLSNCHLEVGNGNEYPEIHYTPTTDMTRVFRDVLKYVHKNNEYGEGSLLNKSNFSTLFPFLYFDLTKQKMDIKDGTTKLTFKYELSGTTATAYSIYALTLYEQDVELIQKDGKIILRL